MSYSRKISDKVIVEVDKTKDFETGHSLTPETLTGSISTLFSEMTNPRYSVLFKLTFFQVQEEFVLSQDLQDLLHCSSKVQIKIRMLSRYTTIILSVIKSQKMSFIIVWKVTGLLVMLKKHDKELKKTSVGVESSLSFISGFDLSIIKLLTDIQLCKIPSSSKLRNKF